jgi:hypothetical protein
VPFFAQVKYPNDSNYISTLSEAQKNNLQRFSRSGIDTAINNFQNYFPRNTSGNYGLPSAPLFIDYQPKALGFNVYNAPYENDMISADNIQYYQTKGPYASLTGIAGSKQEQCFKMLFSNTFKNKMNLTLGFNRYSGLGFYQRQQTFTNNFFTTTNYTSTNGRVGYYAYFLFNKVKHHENGGISDDTLFQEDVRVNKQLLPVNLSAARREVRHSEAEINPWFRINKREDSSTVLSHFIDYQFNYSGNYSKYTDDGVATDSVYNVFYIDPYATKDSTHWRTISNSLNYTLKLNPINAKLRVGYRHELNQIEQYLDSTFINHFVTGGLYISDNNYAGFAKVNYIVRGPNAGDYSIDINNTYTKRIAYKLFKSPFVVKLNASIEKRHPDFIYNTWYSNHFAWNNSFVPTDKVQSLFSIGTQDKRFEIGAVFQSIKNMLYFDDMATPQQTPLTVQNMALFVKKDMLLFKHLGINLGFTYQSSSYQTIVAVPNNIATGALYYQGNLFKKALQLQVGFSGQYYSEFYGYAYMPATNLYYVQTDKTVGNYPYVDFFLSARIKPVRFFVKIDHVTQGFLGTNYSLTPGYLQNDRAFKFGVNWLFFD